MAQDYENAINLDQMDDEEIEGLVRQQLDEDTDFDVATVDVHARGGRVRVEGRVGTEGERQRVEQVLTALGANDFDNDVVVDPNTRAERSEAADDAIAEDAAATGPTGDSAGTTTDTAEHLQPDDGSELYGTNDPQKATEEGKPYTPPEGPTQEGIRSDERH